MHFVSNAPEVTIKKNTVLDKSVYCFSDVQRVFFPLWIWLLCIHLLPFLIFICLPAIDSDGLGKSP